MTRALGHPTGWASWEDDPDEPGQRSASVSPRRPSATDHVEQDASQGCHDDGPEESEDAEPLGPYGAKGVGEPALIPTAPAILNAIRHATGVRLTHVPATPDRVRKAILDHGR